MQIDICTIFNTKLSANDKTIFLHTFNAITVLKRW